MGKAFVATALLAGLWGMSAQAQEKKTVILKGVNNAASCEVSYTYTLEIFPDKVVSTIITAGTSRQPETVAINADGTFRKEYKSGTRKLNMRIEGSVKTRQVRYYMLDGVTCTWEGTF